MNSFFRVDTVFFTFFGYPMSYIEFIGTLLYLWSVWLISKRKMLTWPVGIAGVILYMIIFFQIQLYADALEQLYYLGASLYGWRYWSKARPWNAAIEDVHFSSGRAILAWAGMTAAVSILFGAVIRRLHLWIPGFFSEPASYPYLDSLTTVMSIAAMWLMVRKHIESWIYWIVVDVIGVVLYSVKEVKFIAFLYSVLFVLALNGLIRWLKAGASTQARTAPKEQRFPCPI